MKIVLASSILIMAAVASAAPYKLDAAHTEVGFSVKHLMVSNVKGHFTKFDGGFDYDSAKKEIKNVNITVDADSIETNNADRNAHLKGADFFDTAKNPKITFHADKAEMAKDGKTGKVTGDLTMHGKTEKVTFDLVNNGETEFMGVQKIGFSATTKLERKKWGLNWNKNLDKGGVAVSDEVTIQIEGEANQDVPAKDAKKDDKKKK